MAPNGRAPGNVSQEVSIGLDCVAESFEQPGKESQGEQCGWHIPPLSPKQCTLELVLEHLRHLLLLLECRVVGYLLG